MVGLSELRRRAETDLAAAQNREAKARAALEAASAERERLEGFLAVLAQYEQPDAAHTPRTTTTTRRTSPKGDAAVSVITELRRPLQIDPLADAVEALGVEIGGGDKRNAYLASYLSKDPRLTFHRGRGWWVNELGDLPSDDKGLPLQNTDPTPTEADGGSSGTGDDRESEPVNVLSIPTSRSAGGGT